MKQLRYIFLLVCLLAFQNTAVWAQQIEASAVIDSTNVLIGDQFNLRLEVDLPQDVQVGFPVIGDSLSETVEVISQSPLDTINLDIEDQIKITQDLLVTSFDTGEQFIPGLQFVINFNGITDTIETVPEYFYVHGMEIDTTKGPVDIKKPYEAPVTLSEVYPYILGVIIIGAIIFFIFYYIQRKRQNKPLFSKPEIPLEPPHVVALRELDRIKESKDWQHDEIKKYYSEISDTLRAYIERRFSINAMEYTTDETVQAFNKQKDLLPEKTFSELKNILNLSDLVKFAKYTPLDDDHNMTLMNAYFFVNNTKIEERNETVEDDREGEDVTLK